MTEIDTLLSRYLSIRPESMVRNVLRLLVKTGVEVMGADEGSLLVYDADAKDLRFAMTTGSGTAEDHLIGDRVPLGHGVTGLAAATGEVHIGAPSYKDPQKMERVKVAGFDPEAVIAAPMVLGEELLGVLTAISTQKGKRFTGEHARIYGSFASIAAMVVDQERRLSQYERETRSQIVAAQIPDGPERRIATSLGRIARERPHLLGHVAVMIAAAEKLAFGEYSE
jgi:GAF domain-containing protein